MKLDWTHGNQLTLLENGEAYFPAVFSAIAAAQREVLLETFILFDDPVGRQLRQALIQAAQRGAEVHVLIDGWGSPDLGRDFTGPLAAAGVRLRIFEPAQKLFGTRLNLFRRMHRKLVVVDGQVAFVGGINYSIDHLAVSGPEAKQDYAVRIEGPLVGQIHAFCRASLHSPQPPRGSWLARWRARQALQARPAASEPAPGGSSAAFVTRDNASHPRDIEKQYRAALRLARHRVVIANAYFFPGYGLLKDLRNAAKRGVQVDLILQGQPDMAVVKAAASLLHAHLLRAGVRVHEYCRRPLHGKVATADDRWATVGSSNLDPTSLALNLEANVIIACPRFATELRQHLEQLMQQHCKVVEQRPATPLGSAWAQLRNAMVFHFLRNFPSWLRWLPEHRPQVAQLQGDVR
jgi:cardiolipin synthase